MLLRNKARGSIHHQYFYSQEAYQDILSSLIFSATAEGEVLQQLVQSAVDSTDIAL